MPDLSVDKPVLVDVSVEKFPGVLKSAAKHL
jgi:hypothetical protein